MPDLYDALDQCLDALAQGSSVESALRRYPKLANQLRPLLEAALAAKDAGRVHIPLDVRQRGRADLLKQVEASGMFQARGRGRMIPFVSRLALTGGLLAALVLSSTGLVSASSSSLPGQQLYQVKRSWESLRLLFAFSPAQRQELESDFEQERLDEIDDLLARHSAASITFTGLLARSSSGTWTVSSIPIVLNQTTLLPKSGLVGGAPVSVTGLTRPDGTVDAQEIRVLQAGASLPPLEPSENNEGGGGSDDGGAAIGTPVPAQTPSGNTPDAGAGSPEYRFSGIVQSMRGNVWRINGQPVYVDSAHISGKIAVGSIVRFQGYYASDGKFMVTTMQPQSGGAGGKPGGSSGDGGSSGASSGSEPEDGGHDP